MRAEPGVYGLVASDPTVSRAIDALAADADRALAAIDTARAAARATVWTLAGEHAADHNSDAAAPPPGRPAHRPRCRWLPAAGQRWISGAEVAETTHAAFTGRRRGEQVTTRLIVRRVGPLNPAGADQGELLTAYRHHAVFTDSPMTLLQAETQHRGHAIIEQVIADLRTAPWPTYPSCAWLVCAAIAFDLTRRRRSAGLDVPRPCRHRDDPHAADRGSGPAGPFRWPPHPAPARAVALGTLPAVTVRRRALLTTAPSLTALSNRSRGATEDTAEEPDRPAGPVRPQTDPGAAPVKNSPESRSRNLGGGLTLR